MSLDILSSDYIGKVVIDGRLPGMNEVIGYNRSGWKSGSKEKKHETDGCRAFAKYAMQNGLKPIKDKVDIRVIWYEANGRRDHDNILGGGLKMALDGFVRAGLLQDDSQRFIGRIVSEVIKCPAHPRVEFRFFRSV